MSGTFCFVDCGQEYKKCEQNVIVLLWISNCTRITNTMAALSFAIQKAAFMASWSALMDNYTTRKSDDKLDSSERLIMDFTDCNDAQTAGQCDKKQQEKEKRQ